MKRSLTLILVHAVGITGFGGSQNGTGPAAQSDPPDPPAPVDYEAYVIAFDSERTGNGDIYIVKADGSDPGRVTSSDAVEYWPSWVPDGTAVLFSSNRSGNLEIYRLEVSENLEPGMLTRLTLNDADDGHPVWRPGS